MGCCENKYNVSSTAPATEALKNWRGCCCCLCWCCCFAAKKQALLCLNILFSRNLKTVYKWLSWLHLHSVPSANWQASQGLTETANSAQSSPMPDTQSRELKGPKSRLHSKGRQVGETDSQANETTREGVNQSGCGAANRATRPILPDNSIHMGIRILLIQDGAARNRVLGEAWTKVPRDLLKSIEDRIWWINWRAGGIKVKSQGRGRRRDDWKQSRGSQMIAENHGLSWSQVCPG